MVGRPETARRAPAGVVVERRLAGLDLFERLPALDAVLNAVADDRDHVPILEQVGFVGQAAMARDDVGAAFLHRLRDRDVEHVVQRRDDPGDVAAARGIDERVRRRDEQVAGDDHVRLAEVHDAVAVGVSRRLVDDLQRLPVEEELLLLRDVGVGRPRGRRERRLLPGGRAHAVQDVFVRDDAGADARARAHVAAGDGAAQLPDEVVATHVVRVHVRVDDVANRLVADGADGGHDLLGVGRETGVHQQHAVVAHLQRDVAAGADQHVDVALHVQDVELGVSRPRGRRRRSAPSAAALLRSLPGFALYTRIHERGDRDSRQRGQLRGISLHAGLLPAGRRGRRHILQLQHVLRIHRLGAAAGRLERELFLHGELAQKRVRARQVMRHVALLALDFGHVLTRIRRDLLMRIESPVRRTHERLGQIHRIRDHRDQRQVVVVAHEVLGEHGLVAARDAVAANPPHLQMRGRHRQHVAFPLAGREPLPRVRGVLGRMRTAVHPDRPLGLLPRDVRVVRHELLRRAVELAPDAQVGGAARRVVGGVRLALVFGQREDRRVPAVPVQAARFVDREAEIVADVRPWNALRLILVEPRRPLARQIGADGWSGWTLRQHGDDDAGGRGDQQRGDERGRMFVCHVSSGSGVTAPGGRHLATFYD